MQTQVLYIGKYFYVLYFIVTIDVIVTVVVIIRDVKVSSWMLPFIYYFQVSVILTCHMYMSMSTV